MPIETSDIRHCSIQNFFHCALCLSEKPEDVSPADWQQIQVGMFQKPDGTYLQVWCKRHNSNVTTIHMQRGHWEHCDVVPLGVVEEEF